MNSEKVKEIKKALGNCQKNNCLDCPYFIDEKRYRANDLLLDTINLINELESENERLSDDLKLQQMTDKTYKYNMACENGKQFKQISELKEENTKLKDRIAELENIGLNEDITVSEYLRELERLKKENETLRNAKVVYENVDYCAEDLKKAEKRIAELEKEIEENAFYSKGYAQGIKNTYEVVIPDKLKQFTEGLKEKFNDTEYRAKTKRKTISVEELKAQMDWILHEVVIKNIDETLKEFIER